MLIGCGFRLCQLVKNQNTKITEEEQSSMPAGLLNLQVQQIPRRNQKSSRGVRYKHMQVKSQQRQTITQTFGGLRGPFYWRHLHLLFILINKLNTFSDLFNPHLTLYVIPQLCPNLFLNSFLLVVFIHVLLWSTCQFTSFWSCMIFDTCVTSLSGHSTRSLWSVLIVVILTGRCCGRYAMMIVLLAFFFTYTPQIHWVVDIQVITIISVSVFLTASHTLGLTSTDWDRWLHQYCALKSVLSWQMGCKWWFKLGNICASLRIIVFTMKPETTP